MLKKDLPLSKVYHLLGQGPVIMVTTSSNGKDNVMTMSWHTMIDFDPPLVGIVLDENSHSFKLLKETKECVINIPSVELLSKAVGVGKTTGSKVDKFEKFELSKEPGTLVKAPILTECPANFECKLVDDSMVAKYNLFILEVVKALVAEDEVETRFLHHCGDGKFVVDGEVVTV